MEILVKSLEEKVNKFEKRLNTVRPIMVNLDEKFKKLEKRFNTIDEYIVKNKEIELNAQQFLSEGTTILNDYKLLEEIVYTNKEALFKLGNDSKSVLNSPEPVEQVKNYQRRCKFWNAGFCKYKKDCHLRHPDVICNKDNCSDKTCLDRHPKPCKHWKTGFCKFEEACEFTHDKHVVRDQNKTEDSKEPESDNKTESTIKKSDNYVDYDNIDSDDDSFEETDAKFKCQQCKFSSNTQSNITKHIKSDHKYDCDKCDFETSNKMHLKMHVKAFHKNINMNKVNGPKKRKTTEDIPSSRKKTKTNVVAKKVKRV